jgi:hypothetical protein
VDIVGDFRSNDQQRRVGYMCVAGVCHYYGHFGDDQWFRHLDSHTGGVDFAIGDTGECDDRERDEPAVYGDGKLQ